MDAVLRAFNKDKPGDDPVIHFYEDFLKAYDKAMRAKRGVFYTPSPVVQFIVRSVDEILKTEFGIEDGLASTITWGEMMARKPELALPRFCTAETPFVQVLDPATGTGTFIVEVITQVHAHMIAKWARQGKPNRAQWQPLWNDYVRAHLLPRLYAFELMMAPYAIAHMKIGLKLAETGYTFPEDGPRVNVFLTNALEPAHPLQPELELLAPMLAQEASAANIVKEQLAATIVVGNPPYSVSTSNKGDWIVKLCADYKKDLNEKNIQPLSDDYVKFIRLGQHVIDRSAIGVLGYIINNSFIDGIIHRRMRQSLMGSFNQMYVLDLHGSTKKKETALDGSKDENVFDIMQGVNINLYAKTAATDQSRVQHVSLQGLRTSKYETLLSTPLSRLPWTGLTPVKPDWVLTPKDTTLAGEYGQWFALNQLFEINSSGVKTHRDDFVIDFDKHQLTARIKRFYDQAIGDEQIAEELGLKDNRDWSLSDARIGHFKNQKISPIGYRPFDAKVIYYDETLIDFDRRAVMGHMLRPNLLLASLRQARADEQGTFFAASNLVNKDYVSLLDTCTAFPLWLYAENSRTPNLSPSFITALQATLGLASSEWQPENASAPLHAEKVFHYIYAVLHSPSYRSRYASFLRTDFPRIPMPASMGVFNALSVLGEQLVGLHLLEREAEATHALPAWFGTDFSLQKVGEKGKALADDKVFINATSGFANVHQSVWQHTIGGYQVLHKWLDDRRKAKRSLSQDDITHWLRVYAALQATQKLMLQVDEAIEANGGWPGTAGALSSSAFSQNHPPPDAATLAAEQMVQKGQLKAQKKAAKAVAKSAEADPTVNGGLFPVDSDMDDLAATAGKE